MKSKNGEKDISRLGRVGGQAVIEGVMMKAGDRAVTTCRKENGEIVVTDGSFRSVRKKNRVLNIPILRGIINFVEMMILSVKTLEISADALDLDTDKDGKKNGSSALVTAIMVIATVLGVALAVGLFMFLPNFLVSLIGKYVIDFGAWEAVAEGALKIIIFIAYLLLVSLMKDIKRTFMYHGAEHKSVACFEAGAELTPESARNYSRFHPRCGTSFMFFMILLGVIAGLFVKMLIPGLSAFAYTGIRLAILPLIVGFGYEIIMLAGKHDNVFTRILSTPGLWVQRITTKEPTDDMLEVAIISLKCALRDDFPEFEEFYKNREWEPKREDGAELEAADGDGETALTDAEANADGAAVAAVGESGADDGCRVCEDEGTCTEAETDGEDALAQ